MISTECEVIEPTLSDSMRLFLIIQNRRYVILAMPYSHIFIETFD
jgi:hypothetical protein